jgi:hypothetical protein
LGHRARERNEIVGEVGFAGDADDRHDDVIDEPINDLAERRADDHADGEIERVAPHREVLEFLPHASSPTDE